MKRVIVVEEEAYFEILRQGIKHEVLFKESEFEGVDEFKGVIISAFKGGYDSVPLTLFIRNLEGETFKVKVKGEAWVELTRREDLDF